MLQRALQSIVDQTFQDYEIIIVDDGSTDSTPDYVASLDNPKVRSVRFDRNRGGNAARNEGVKQSSGALIAFCDDDDCWMPQKLEKQVAVIQNEHVDLCYTAKNIVHEEKSTQRYSLLKPRYANLHRSIMYDNFIGSTSSVIVKREVLDAVGGFDPDLHALQDYDLYIRILADGYTATGLTEPLITYYIIDEKRSITCSFMEFKRAADYLLQKYRHDPYIRFLRRGLRRITLKRTVHSKNFLSDIIRFYWGEITRFTVKRSSQR